MKEKAFTVWFTGISRSGKTTLANMLCERLAERGIKAESLDSGKLRREFNQELGFTREAIEKNLKRVAYDCQVLNRNGVVAIVAAISPYKALRDAVREQSDTFIEVYCEATPEQLQDRDPEGFFEKARRNEILNVAGVNAPYEPPDTPEIHLKTTVDSPESCLDTILKTLEILGQLPTRSAGAYTPEEEALIKNRLRELGYI
ncbi:MAG: adenylyl-sulfate kinase [Planctomycetes bacterium]|nr:adenylyl-sulfate kinase [Planctomycetota bacterium]